jgi:membrane protein implicated in regulation of membrane protease activity
MAWWLWFLAGFALLLLELVTPGTLFFIFFGVSAFVVAALDGLGMEPWAQFLVFGTLSIVSLLTFRSPLMRRLKLRTPEGHSVDAIAGEVVTLTEDLPALGTGKAELRGTVWLVENAAAQALEKGRRCRVQRVAGLKLVVAPE